MPLTTDQLQERRQDLLVDPHTFLSRRLLYAPHVGAPMVNGRPLSMEMNLYFYESQDGDGTRPGSILGVHSRHRHAAENLMIQCGNPNFIVGDGGIRPEDHALYNRNIQFNAHWVGTNFYAAPNNAEEIPQFPWYTLPNAPDGPDLMFTQRLTGCCFLYRAAGEGAGTQVAHIMPTPNVETGAELEARLRGYFAGQNVSFYGRSRYQQGREVTIVGARNANGEWQFFAQKRDSGAGALGRAMRSIHRF